MKLRSMVIAFIAAICIGAAAGLGDSSAAEGFATFFGCSGAILILYILIHACCSEDDDGYDY